MSSNHTTWATIPSTTNCEISKFNVKGKSEKFPNQALKRPNTVVFNESQSKKKKKHDDGQQDVQIKNAPDRDVNLQQQRKSLPVYILRKRLLAIIREYPTLIIVGETGSGKTTQIPQLLLHSDIVSNSSCIGVTAPRRVAAVSVARRVAQEQRVKLGKLVGYCVRFDDVTSSQTRIKYMTDGMMVREAITDEILSDYSVVIIDEAHERSVQTDVLLGIAKRAQNLRKLKNLPPLKLLVMSAMMDVNKFAKYFDAPVLYLEGRQHEVRVFQSLTSHEDYAFAALVTAFKIHRETPANEDILAFLTGQEEIETAVLFARQAAKQLDDEGGGYPPLKVFPLYSALPMHLQMEAFKPSPPGMRKLVLSTNVAETSVTISGIRHVIDSGVVKARTHHPTTGLDVLRVEKISKAQAFQRTGRAGRETAGKCYRVYTEEDFASMVDLPVPEIQRCSLAGVALQLFAMGVDITTFDFMDKPPKQAVDVAVSRLEKLGAVKGSPPQLTALGRTMSLFPLDPSFTKVILASVEHQCLEEALTVIAVLSGETVFNEPPAKRHLALAAKSRFASPEGDHVTLLNVFRAFMDAKLKKAWCHENFLNHRNLEYALDVRQQLAALAKFANLEKASCGTNTEQLRKALLEGLRDNLAELQRNHTYVTAPFHSRLLAVVRDYITLFMMGETGSGKTTQVPQLFLYSDIVSNSSCIGVTAP